MTVNNSDKKMEWLKTVLAIVTFIVLLLLYTIFNPQNRPFFYFFIEMLPDLGAGLVVVIVIYFIFTKQGIFAEKQSSIVEKKILAGINNLPETINANYNTEVNNIIKILNQLSEKLYNNQRQLLTKILENRNIVSNAITFLNSTREKVDYTHHFLAANREIHIMALTGESFTNAIDKRRNDFLNMLLEKNTRIRILLLCPDDIDQNIEEIKYNNEVLYNDIETDYLRKNQNSLIPFWLARSIGDGRDLKVIKQNVENVKNYWQKQFPTYLWEKLEELYPETDNNYKLLKINCDFKIKYHQYPPFYSYFKADREVYIGLYNNKNAGNKSPVFKININNPDLINPLENDFIHVNKHRSKRILEIRSGKINPSPFE